MHILLIDDEPLARMRLRSLLAECDGDSTPPGPHQISEAADARQAMDILLAPLPGGAHPVQLLLLDIHMPGQDGLALARVLQGLPLPPAIIFVTAHSNHAVAAFELDAVDYLTKPVRRARLHQALGKAARVLHPMQAAAHEAAAAPALLIQERGTTVRLPLAEVLYLKAEQKYITVRTVARSYVLGGALSELEACHGAQLLRIHRNALVARRALRSLEHQHGGAAGEAWCVRLHGIPEPLAVSRRQLPQIRAALRDNSPD